MTAHLDDMTTSIEPARGHLLAVAEYARDMGDRRTYINDEGNEKGPRSPKELEGAPDVIAVIEPDDLTRRASQYLRRLRRLDNRRKDGLA